jgi:hypothetical protein
MCAAGGERRYGVRRGPDAVVVSSSKGSAHQVSKEVCMKRWVTYQLARFACWVGFARKGDLIFDQDPSELGWAVGDVVIMSGGQGVEKGVVVGILDYCLIVATRGSRRAQ